MGVSETGSSSGACSSSVSGLDNCPHDTVDSSTLLTPNSCCLARENSKGEENDQIKAKEPFDKDSVSGPGTSTVDQSPGQLDPLQYARESTEGQPMTVYWEVEQGSQITDVQGRVQKSLGFWLGTLDPAPWIISCILRKVINSLCERFLINLPNPISSLP